jgi:hypothetical protein
LCSSGIVAQYANAVFACEDVVQECREGFRGERGTSQERWFEDNLEDFDWKWVDVNAVKGGAAAAEGRKDDASEMASLKDYLTTFSLTGTGADKVAGADQSSPDEIWLKIKNLPVGNKVTARSGTITRFLKEAKNLKLYDPSNENAMKGGQYNTDTKLRELENIIKIIIWGKANLEQQTALIKAVRAPVAVKAAGIERAAGTSAAQKKADASDNTVALVAHALCDPDNYNLIMQARGKVPQEMRPEALSQGIQTAKANRYKQLVERAIERQEQYVNTLTVARVGEALFNALKTFDATEADLENSTEGWSLFYEIEGLLIKGVERVNAAHNKSGQYKDGTDMFKEMYEKYGASGGGGKVTVNDGVFYALVLWHGKDLNFLSANLGGQALDAGGLARFGLGHGPGLTPRSSQGSQGSSEKEDPPGGKDKPKKTDAAVAGAIEAIASHLGKRTHAAMASDEAATKASTAAAAASNVAAKASTAAAAASNVAASHGIAAMLKDGSYVALIDSDEEGEAATQSAAMRKHLRQRARALLSLDDNGGFPQGLPPRPPAR